MRNSLIGLPSNYPHVSPDRPEISPSEYDDLCHTWARQLTEGNLRSLTADYMRGVRDEVTEDAYEEFQRRKRLGLLSDQQITDQSLRKPKSRARSSIK